jgi:2-keto-4-pentenoate hydratase/2-oxohepta-3-ene-1,7-dioic acid hydratase in catechol pathway
MRLATFVVNGEDDCRAGDVQGDRVVTFAGDLTVEDLVRLDDPPAAAGESFALNEVELTMPYKPRAVFMVGANYKAHVQAVEDAGKWPDMLAAGEIPCLQKGPASPIGPYDQIVRPPEIECLDYEGELMIIVGPRGQAGGYAVANDVSARDVGDKWQLMRHKGGDTFCPWGPWVTTADEVPDPYDLQLRTWVDGELRQDASTSEMVVRGPEIIRYIEKTISVQPGDAILTGTPAGTIAEMVDPAWLQAGQRVRIEFECLGYIENEIVVR